MMTIALALAWARPSGDAWAVEPHHCLAALPSHRGLTALINLVEPGHYILALDYSRANGRNPHMTARNSIALKEVQLRFKNGPSDVGVFLPSTNAMLDDENRDIYRVSAADVPKIRHADRVEIVRRGRVYRQFDLADFNSVWARLASCKLA